MLITNIVNQKLDLNNRFVKYQSKEDKHQTDKMLENKRSKHNISSISERNSLQIGQKSSINSNSQHEGDFQHSWSHSYLADSKTQRSQRDIHQNIIKRLKNNISSKTNYKHEESKIKRKENPKSRLDKYVPLPNNEAKSKEICFNKTIDLQSNMTGDLYNGLETEKFVPVHCSDRDCRTGCETQRRTYHIPKQDSKIAYDFINARESLDSKRINDHRINKKFLLEGKKKSQANSYMKEGRLLKSLKKTSNTMSTGFIQPYNKIVLDSYDSSIMNPNKISRCSLKDETLVSKIIHSQNHVSNDCGRKPKSSMRQNYLKRNK